MPIVTKSLERVLQLLHLVKWSQDINDAHKVNRPGILGHKAKHFAFGLYSKSAVLVVDSQKEGIVNDIVAGQKLAVAANLRQQRLALLANNNLLVGLLEVNILEGNMGISVLRQCHPSHPRALQVIPSVNFAGSVEHVSHDNEVQVLLWPPRLPLRPQAVEAQKTNHQRAGVFFDVIRVPFEHLSQKYEFLGCDGLHHVLAIRRVIEEGTALSFGRELGQR
mmetsp:Transcript_111045/g.265033  ORF Transcript_111045/g.265033 Transcript_111045/m.265033 type:complete len:221 (+) Transcript_111045:299-961(+)